MPSTPRPVISLADAVPDRRRGGDLRVLLGPRTVGAGSGFMGMALLEPGEHVVEHYHPYSEEFLFVVEGEVTVELDGEPHPVAADQALHVPIGMRHRVRNSGSGRARVVFHLSPLAPRPELGHVDTEALAPVPPPDAAPEPAAGPPACCRAPGNAGGTGPGPAAEPAARAVPVPAATTTPDAPAGTTR